MHNTSDSGPCEVSISSDTPAWEEYLSGRADSTIFHDPRWGEVMQAAYGNRPYYLTGRRGGQVVGVLMLVAQKSLLFGSHMCSLPYFDAAGVLADDESAREALIGEARNFLVDGKVHWVELRQIDPVGESLETRTDKVTMWLDLPDGSEAMWEQLKTKVRTKVRKSRKSDLEVVTGGAELLDEYHAVYARTMRDLGSPPHSRRFFRLIIDVFGDVVKIFVARSAGGAVAASLTMTDRRGFHVPWSGSDKRFGRLMANRLMYWTMLADAADAGAGMFDFGRSTRDSGTYGFKKEWGAREVPLYWHYLLPEGGQMPELRPDSRKYRLMVACWKKLPVGLAKILGPRIIRKLS